MQAHNHMTNQLGLIETLSTNVLGWLTMSIPTGFSLEVFRAGSYLASITPEDTSRRWSLDVVMRGDTVLKVNLGYRHQIFRGELRGDDGLARSYEVEVRLHVSNAALFALHYLQKSDPIFLAQTEITRQLEIYAQGPGQATMSERNLRELAEQDFPRTLQHLCGIGINQIIRVSLSLAAPYAEMQTNRLATMVEEERISNQAHLERHRFRSDEFLQQTWDEQALAFRVRDIRLAMMVDQYLNRQRIREAIDEGMAHRIHEQFHNGLSLEDIRNENPEIEGLLQTSIQERTGRLISQKPQFRFLQARLPERVKVADKIPLQARVALLPTLNRSIPLRALSIPPEGADLKLVLDCPGFLLHSASIATVHVALTADSDWVLFELEALHDGVHTLEIAAFNEGAFLGTLSLQLTVDSLVARGPSVDHLTPLPLRSPQEGEVTLVIRYDPLSTGYRYQFRGTTFGETDELRSGPLRRGQEEIVADLVALLNEQARNLTEYSAEETRRWLQGKGVELWKELIPKELENLFWQERENIKWMTILSAGDPVPWEMMYPTSDAGDDAGFLAEQFPIVRWIFGSAPTTRLKCSQPFFVVPDDAPPTAEYELVALRRITGGGQNINELTPLLKLLDNAEFDTLHFACHNIFRADSPTSSSIQLGSKRFVPTFLNKYNKHFHSPLVFLNACRSDGMAANYTSLAGWAKSFLVAGAGAFIGSLWEVRDSSASRFAETFYQALYSGIPLGDAMKQARMAIQNEPGDPTWLAYTLYGNPTAILLKDVI